MIVPWLRSALYLFLCLALRLPIFGQSTAEEFLKAGIEFGNQNPGQAIYYLTRAIEINPNLSAAFWHRAKALESADNMSAALVDLTRALELDPKSAGVWFQLAMTQRRVGDLDTAISSFKRVTELKPTEGIAYSEIAEIMEERKDLSGAFAAYSRAIERETERNNSGIYYRQRARIRKITDDLDGAIVDYSKAIELYGHNTFYPGEPSFGRGSVFYMKRSWKEALRDFRAAAAICRNRMSFEPRLHFWLVRVRMGEKEEADKELAAYLTDETIDRHPGEYERKYIGFILDQVPQSDLIAYSHDRIEKENQYNHDCPIWYYAGIKRLLAGDKAGAVELFKKSIDGESRYFPDEYYWARSELKTMRNVRQP